MASRFGYPWRGLSFNQLSQLRQVSPSAHCAAIALPVIERRKRQSYKTGKTPNPYFLVSDGTVRELRGVF